MSSSTAVSRDTHCKVLGLPATATKDEIRVAYKKLALKWHPDRHANGKERAKQKFVEIHEAYRELMDDKDRRHRREKHPDKDQKAGEKPSSPGTPLTTPPPSPKPSTRSSASRSSSESHVTPSTAPTSPPSNSRPMPPSPKPSTHSAPPHPATSHATSSHSRHTTASRPSLGSRPLSDPNPITESRAPKSNIRPTPSAHPKSSDHSHHHDQAILESPRTTVRPFITRLRKKAKLGYFCQDRSPKSLPKQQKLECDTDDDSTPPVASPLRPVMRPRDNSNEWTFPLKLSLEEMLQGTHYSFNITRHLMSNEEKEVRIELEVPPGCQAGTKIRCPKVGHECKDGSVQDVVFVIEEVPHDRFRRVKNDLFMDVTLPWMDSLATEDGELCVEGLDGKEFTTSIPYASQRQTKGRILVIGAGMPIRKGGKVVGRGDLTVRWELVVMPTSKTNTLKKDMHPRH